MPRRPASLPPEVAAALLERWREPHRRHHGERHLTEVLAAVALLADPTEDTEAVDLAAWYHDAVYAGRPDDEVRSATLDSAQLTSTGADPALAAEVVRLVLLTRNHDPAPGDRPGALLCDADLSVLGADPRRYRAYVAAVRAEYPHVDDTGWRTGRTAVLPRVTYSPRGEDTAFGAALFGAYAASGARPGAGPLPDFADRFRPVPAFAALT